MGVYTECEGLLILVQTPLTWLFESGAGFISLGPYHYHHIQFPRCVFRKGLFPTEPYGLTGVQRNSGF